MAALIQADPAADGILWQLFFVCTLYAILLHFLQRYYHPNWTWVTVVFGSGVLLGGALWRLYEIGVVAWPVVAWFYRVHGVGGTPIVVWQITEIIGRYLKRKEENNGTASTTDAARRPRVR